jgi:capsid protein
MGIFSRKSKPQVTETSSSLPSTNPHRSWKPNATRQALYAAMMRDGFFSTNVDRLLYGWETTGNSIDYYLMNELRSLRARSRSLIRSNPYGKRFIATVKSNVVGPSGVKLQAKSVMRDGTLDADANNAIEKGF